MDEYLAMRIRNHETAVAAAAENRVKTICVIRRNPIPIQEAITRAIADHRPVLAAIAAHDFAGEKADA
jgi:hypothetical protein